MKINLLLCDDEKDFTDTLGERLERRNFNVTTAYSGSDAIDIFNTFNIDVTVLDLVMPGLDGIATMKKIREISPLTQNIILTGKATVQTAIEGMKKGAYDYLLKPVEIDDLVKVVKKAYQIKAEHEERIRNAQISDINIRRGW